ncbi:MAG: hypothetical protein JWO11_4341 [Nocardioides sp.]|nr:hypothetical protein [Nocardioides sp.]
MTDPEHSGSRWEPSETAAPYEPYEPNGPAGPDATGNPVTTGNPVVPPVPTNAWHTAATQGRPGRLVLAAGALVFLVAGGASGFVAGYLTAPDASTGTSVVGGSGNADGVPGTPPAIGGRGGFPGGFPGGQPGLGGGFQGGQPGLGGGFPGGQPGTGGGFPTNPNQGTGGTDNGTGTGSAT